MCVTIPCDIAVFPADKLSSYTALHAFVEAFDGRTADRSQIEMALHFFVAHTRGTWHNRARARLARKFKWVKLTAQDRMQLFETIINKWHAGEVDEQFRDQLRLAIHFNCAYVEQIASQFVTTKRTSLATLQFAKWVQRLLVNRRRSNYVCVCTSSKCASSQRLKE
jgi:hypothetical protein